MFDNLEDATNDRGENCANITRSDLTGARCIGEYDADRLASQCIHSGSRGVQDIHGTLNERFNCVRDEINSLKTL